MRPTHRMGKLFRAFRTALHLFTFAHIQRAKGECCFEPDDLDCMGAAVSGGVHYIGRGGCVLLRRQARPCTQRILCGMAAGIMLAASVWSLLLPAIERGRGLHCLRGSRRR